MTVNELKQVLKCTNDIKDHLPMYVASARTDGNLTLTPFDVLLMGGEDEMCVVIMPTDIQDQLDQKVKE